MECKNCNKPIDYFPGLIESLAYKHSDGYYSCSGNNPVAIVTYAEPKKTETE